MDILEQIAQELTVQQKQVACTVELFDDGATVPFIARYRKEVTGGLDDTQLRLLEERLYYLRELEERKLIIIKSIKEQNKLTNALEKSINDAMIKTRLEDLYLPYKPKRRTKGQIAIEAGLLPLADELWDNHQLDPKIHAIKYIDENKGIVDVKSALEGARYILMERLSEHAELIGQLRDFLWQNGLLTARCLEGKEKEGEKFQDYFAYQEQMKKIPSHRMLAILRGRQQGVLDVSIKIPDEPKTLKEKHPCELMISDFYQLKEDNLPADSWLQEVVRWTWRVKLLPKLESELVSVLRDQSEDEAIQVFAKNLKDLLLAAPAGLRPTLGLDPGIRTGVKVVVVDATGKLLDHTTIFPHPPKREWQQSIGKLATLCLAYGVELVSIGNGTGSRETDRLVNELIKAYPKLKLTKIVISEAGASVYSASEFAAKEFPNLDVSLRGAVSIARRLQDPLAELVKIEPKAIGVGQYQHDINQSKLSQSLETVVEDCVNAVGVDLNTASSALLTRVSGLNKVLADNIVEFRDKNGTFTSREQLKQVDRMGAKTFEQSAGFLRISNGDNPLDASSVHPESYSLVESIGQQNQRSLNQVIKDTAFLKSLNPEDYTDLKFGLPTVLDVISELDKPGRDPRPEFKAPEFKEGIVEIKDLKLDMVLEGIATNVTKFGVFVDIGVHQDGLVHISALADKFIKDPSDIVKAGDIVKVKVMEVNVERKRIALSMRMTDSAENYQLTSQQKESSKKAPSKNPKNIASKKKENYGSFAQLFSDAKKMR